MSRIRDARVHAGLTAAEAASVVGRSSEWFSLVEAGAAALAPEHEKLILTAIGRLQRFAETVASAKEKLTADLKLPPARTGTVHGRIRCT